MSNLHIITTVLDSNCYDKTIKHNPFMNCYKITAFNQEKDNIIIPKRYNSFIKEKIFTDKIKDTWLVFCHQDFGFLNFPLEILEKQNKNFLYGPSGVRKRKFGNLKFKLWKDFLPIPYIKTKVLALGQIWQGYDPETFKKANRKNPFKVGNEYFYFSGKQLEQPEVVDTVDCMCLIVHSSLIKKYKLLFDEKLDWHCYSEDFSLNAKHKHGILTKAVQMDCKHLSRGNSFSKGFEKCFGYITNKYKNCCFCTACRNTYDKY